MHNHSKVHDIVRHQFPSVCHGRFLAVEDDLVRAGLGFTADMLSRLLYTAMLDRRILIEVRTKNPRWCTTPPATLECFYQPWTNCSQINREEGGDVKRMSLRSYWSRGHWFGLKKHMHNMRPDPLQFLFRPNARVQRHVADVVAQCGGRDYWTVFLRDSPEKRAELIQFKQMGPDDKLPGLEQYVRRLPGDVTRILWQTSNPALFEAAINYSKQREGLKYCYTNFSRYANDVWGGNNANLTDESGLTSAVNGELGRLGNGLISLKSSTWTSFLHAGNKRMRLIQI